MMHAITHLNPVLGVDVHIVQPPGPVPPVPIPHPYVGIVFDPADYVPIIGSSVSIHGLPRAIAGTAGKPIPSHIPIGGTFIKPPGYEDEDFMGSSTVAMDGDAASYMALPVISCQDVGMPPPFRTNPKKKGKMKSMVLPTSVMIPIPAGPPVLIGGPPTISLMALGMRFGMAALGKGLKRLAKTKLARKIGKAFKAAKKKAFRNMKPGFLKCKVLKAEPVDIVTGEVVVDQQDFSIPGRIPVEWNRHYGSQSERMGVCGYGWETQADARLEFDYDGTVIFHDGTGVPAYFDSLPTEWPVQEPVDGGTLHHIENHYVVRLKDGLHYYFPVPKEPVEEVLVEYVMDLCKNHVKYVRDENGLNEIVESAGRSIDVTSINGLIQKMRIRHPDSSSAHPLVCFEYSESGDLVCVYDALNSPYRFRYNNHRLIQHTDKNKLSFYYDYDEYFSDGRCVHAWGDGGLYDYQLEYLELAGKTRVTDSLGNISVVQYDNRYQIVKEIDPLGGITEYKYDEAGRTTAVTDQEGRCTEYHYDDAGNAVKIVRPDGSAIETRYDINHKPIAITDPNGNIWQQQWDKHGLLLLQVGPKGSSERYEYNENGDLVAYIDPRGYKTQFKPDDLGNTKSIINPLNYESFIEHDLFSNPCAIVDNGGYRTEYEYDGKSRLQKVIYPSGNHIECSYDNEDNLTEYRDEAGRITRLQYTGIGEIARRIQANNTTVEYRYDTEERLICVINERKEHYQLIRDPLGRVIEEIDYWGNSRKYEYDKAGNLKQSEDALGRVTQFESDPLGRLLSKIYFNGRTESFTYDPNGNLIKTKSDCITVNQVFDEENFLVREEQGDITITSKYDASGNRIRRTSSFENEIKYQYDAMDNVKAISINGSDAINIKRDARGFTEKEILSQRLKRSYQYDSDGLLISQNINNGKNIIIQRKYEHDATGNLTKRIDSNKGTTVFNYDAIGRVIKHINPEGKIKQFLYDLSGNLLKNQNTRKNGERTLNYEGTNYCFDAAGNLVERKGARGHTRFEWDGNNRLTAAVHDDGSRTEFTYDAQGRRFSKITGDKAVNFAWDGDYLLSDSKDGKGSREFVFYPDSFEPLAIIDKYKDIYYFQNDAIGLPHEVCDTFANIIWSASYGTFGDVKKFYVKEIDNPIRLQGQYYDKEIDLCYNRFRYFDPKIGDFISQDPLGLAAGTNIYWYAPNVWGWVDPLGFKCKASKKAKWKSRRSFQEGDTGLKDHARRHSDLSPEDYLRKGQKNILSGRKLKGGGKYSDVNYYIREVDDNSFSMTITDKKGDILSIDTWQQGGTPMTQQDIIKGLEKSGVTPPKGFWEKF